jgi:hypothetical protein
VPVLRRCLVSSWLRGRLVPCWLRGRLVPCWLPGCRASRWLRGCLVSCWLPGCSRRCWPASLGGHGRSSSSPAGWPLCSQTARTVSSTGCRLSSWARRWPPLSSAGCLARTRRTGFLAALKRHRKRRCRRLRPAMLLSRWRARWPGHDRSRPGRPPAAGPLCAPGSACRRAAFCRRAWGRDRFPVPANYPRGSRSPKSRHHSVACGFCELVGERHRKFRRPAATACRDRDCRPAEGNNMEVSRIHVMRPLTSVWAFRAAYPGTS